MFLRGFSIAIRNFRGITREVKSRTSSCTSVCHYGRFAPRRHAAIVNEDELFDVDVKNTQAPPPRKIKSEPKLKSKNPKVSVKKLEDLPEGGVFDFESDQFEESEQNRKRHSKSHKEYEGFEPESYNENYSFEDGAALETENDVKSEKPKRKRSQKKKEEAEKKEKDKQFFTKLYENEKTLTAIMLSIKSRKQRKKKDQILLEGNRFIQDAIKVGMVPEMIIFSRSDDIKGLPMWNKEVKFYKVPYRSIQMWSTLTTPPGVLGIFEKPSPLKPSESLVPLTIICDNVRDPGNMGSILRAAAGIGCEKVLLTKGCVDFWDPKVLRSAAGAHFRVPVFGSQTWGDIKSVISSDARIYVADNNDEPNFRQEGKEDTEEKEDEEEKDEDSNEEMSSSESTDYLKFDPHEKIKEFPVIPYFAADYTQSEVILIVGGETHGLSMSAFKMMWSKDGVRVNIPLENGIDSLNAGMALGIIGFEIKRQFLAVHRRLGQIAQ